MERPAPRQADRRLHVHDARHAREHLADFPQPKSQKLGVGLPIARAVVIVSLATASTLELALGPYPGQETGESACLRWMLEKLTADDMAVLDRYFRSFKMIAL